MLPLFVIGAIVSAIRRSQMAPAIQVPQSRNAADYANAIAASQAIVPMALRDTVVLGPTPAMLSGNLPVGLGAIPDLSLLTEFECVMDTPQPDAVEAVQINPSTSFLSYGAIKR